MDEFYSVGHRALIRVSLAVLLLDDLTGKPVTGSNARAWIENEKPPIKKNDGWFVFTDLRPGDCLVRAEGGVFQLSMMPCQLHEGRMETLTIRLKPSRVYPVPSHCLRVEGRADLDTAVTFINCRKNAGFKLLADAEKGSSVISVFHADGIRLEGRSFRLTSTDGVSEDLILIGAVNREGQYQLAAPLQEDHPRIGSQLFPTESALTNEKGEFFLVLKDISASGKLIAEARGETTVIREYDHPDMIRFRPDLRRNQTGTNDTGD